MSRPAPAAPDRLLVVRGRSGPWLLGAIVALAVYLVVDALVRGYVADTLRALPWLAALCWAVYLVLVRPCAHLSPSGAIVVNVLRRHDVPWQHVSYVTYRSLVTIVLDDGRTLTCWGVPAGRDRRPPDVFTPYLEADGTGRADAVVSRWDVVGVAGTLICLVGMALSLL